MSDSNRARRRTCALLFIAAFGLGGCALVWTSKDTSGEKAGKLAARIPLAVVTLGISEVVISQETERVSRWKVDDEKNARRDKLIAEMDRWKEEAATTKDKERRALALTFFQAAREDLARLEGQSVSPVPASPEKE